ncbi:MAG: MFS transporter [Muribaculaceae bacterium]|nr:MFS transporter [Muribaculaceae bacterium]
MGFWKLWNLSFGFFGVQIAYALQSSQVSRIFSTIGADPHDLSYFWILPPLMGMIVQPIVGVSSDRTWNRFGRRLPYLIIGALVAMIVMCFLPNAGSLGLSIGAAIVFGLVMLMFLDTSINMAMQPFKMLVGDFVNEKQKGLAYSIQSFLCNAGSVVGYLAPFVLAWFLPTTAPEGEVPATVTVAFYLGAAILLLCVIYTMAKVKEMPPKEYAYYHGIVDSDAKSEEKKEKVNLLKLLAHAPKVFWTVGIVQFFCWAGFLYMWTYSTDAVAIQAFDAPSQKVVESVSIDGKAYADKYLFNDKVMVLDNGRFLMAGICVDGEFTSPSTVVVDGDTIISGGQPVYVDGVAKIEPHNGSLDLAGRTLAVEGRIVEASRLETVSQFSLIEPGTVLTLAHIAKADGNGEYFLEDTSELPAVSAAESLDVNYKTVLNSASSQYQAAGDWNGVLLAIQGGVAVLWALLLARFRNRKLGYSLSLLIGAAGFLSICYIQNKYLLCVSYGLAGCGWAAMLAMPFTILTNALSGKNIGAYLGLFNCTICLPQIIAALVGGLILNLFPIVSEGASAGVANTVMMLGTSGVLLLLGALAVWVIKETSGEHAAE